MINYDHSTTFDTFATNYVNYDFLKKIIEFKHLIEGSYRSEATNKKTLIRENSLLDIYMVIFFFFLILHKF